MLEIRIAPGRQMEAALDDERLDPGRVGFENPAGYLDEAIQVGPALDGNDRKRFQQGVGGHGSIERRGAAGASVNGGRPAEPHAGQTASSYKPRGVAAPVAALVVSRRQTAPDRAPILTRGRQLRSTSTRNLLKCLIGGPGRMEQSEENCGIDRRDFRLDSVACV